MLDGLSAQLLEVVPNGLLIVLLEQADDDTSLSLVAANAAARKTLALAPHDGQRLTDLLSLPRKTLQAVAACCRDGLPRALPGAAPLCGSVSTLGDGRAAILLDLARPELGVDRDAPGAVSLLDTILEQLPAMVFVKRASDLCFERFNRAGEELLGVSRKALLGKSDYDLFPAEQADFFVENDRQVLAQRALKDTPEEPIETPAGTRWLHTRKIPILDARGEPRYLVGVSLDITEQKRARDMGKASQLELERRVRERTGELERQIAERERAERALARSEEQLRQAQKMEAVGRLAGGIAHDFNNLLSVVLGYTELMLQQLPADAPLREHVEQVNLAGSRAAELTRQLLAFSRRQVLRPRTLDLNDVVAQLAPMLHRLLGEDVELVTAPAPHLGLVKADLSQLEQVLMNLVVNARDAMPTGGTLRIETRNVSVDAAFAADHLGISPGPHVLLAVSDTGCGMDKATQARIFEPFFTTKETGKGTGLGLSTVIGIVQQSGGTVWVYSEPDHGTTFKVYLPVVATSHSAPPARPKPVASAGGSETIALVEDDAQVRAFAASSLRRLGYQVIEFDGPTAALRELAGGPQPIDLLLTDVVMPGMTGPALAGALQAHMPGLRVLYMSGYTDDEVVRRGVLDAGVGFLQKPLTPAALSRGVREALERATDERVQ